MTTPPASPRTAAGVDETDGLSHALRRLSRCADRRRRGRPHRPRQPVGRSAARLRGRRARRHGDRRARARRDPPAPRGVPRAPSRATPRAAADGHADRARRAAQGRQRGDGRDRPQPAAGPRPAARRRRDPRHRRLSARQAGAAARPLQRVPGRSSGGWRSTRATRRCCSSACPPWRREALEVERRDGLSCSSRTGSSSASPAASACCRARRSATASRTGPTRSLGFVLAQGRPVIVARLPHGAPLHRAAGLARRPA